MTSVQKFNREVWWVLQRIEEETYAALEDEPVIYEVSKLIASGVPSYERQKNIIRKLQEWGAVKIVYETDPTGGGVSRYLFKLEIQPKFEEIYKKFQATCDLTVYLNNHQEELFKVAKKEIDPKEANIPKFAHVDKPQPQESVEVTETFGEKRERLWRLLDNLKDQHDAFVNLPEREFFLGIADYIKFIVETPELEKIAQEVKQQEAEDEKKVAELEELVRKETEKTATQLSQLIKDHKIDDKGVARAYQEYIDVKEGRIQSSATLEEALWGELTGVIRAIRDTEHKDIVNKYVDTFPDSDNISGYSFSKHYNDYKKELRRFRDRRKTSIWGSWDSLVLAYLVVHKFDEELERLDPIKDVWRRMNFIGIHGEMQEVLNSNQKPRIQFIQDEYKTHLNRVHSFFTRRLEEDIPLLQVVKDVRSEALKTLTNFQFPVIEVPKKVLDDMAEITKQTNALVKSYQSLASLADTVSSIKKTLPDLPNELKSPQFGSKLIEQMKQSQNLLSSGPVIPTKFIDPDYRRRAEEAEIRKLQLIKLRRELEEDDINLEIEKWLNGKDDRTINRIWRVVRALNYEWELRDQDTFKIPHDKFKMYKITHNNDIEAILTNLHNRKFIFVSRKVAEQPPSDDPANKPGGMQLWQPIIEDPRMIQQSDTQVEIFPVRFVQLVKVLRRLALREDTEISSTEPEKRQDEQESDGKSNFMTSYKLIFTPEDGITHYRGADYQFTGKSKALLGFLSQSKNTTFPLDDIKAKCNPNIANERAYFKGDKDMRDTVNYIREQLKVKRGEYFPIQKQNGNWIWIEK